MIPINTVAAPILRTRRVENMQVAKIRWLMSQARLRVRPGMTRRSRKREVAVVYPFLELADDSDCVSYEGAMKNGRRTFVARDVIAYMRSAKVPTRVAFS